ncbi:MAG: oxidoreductase [Candidatus Cryptobacteroides sp.]
MKVVLITGASSGIGYMAAKLLAEKGNIVYGAARRVEKIEELRPFGVIPVRMDITDESSIRSCVEKIISEQGRIDALVNNAGYGYYGAIETVAIEEAKKQFDVNLFGTARLTQLVLPYMREQHNGRIVNVASIAGRMTLYLGAWYHASKYALEAFSDALRMEVKPFGIDVSIVEPGGIRTDWGLVAADNLIASSCGSVYEKHAVNQAGLMRNAYSGNMLSKPELIAGAIVKAVSSRRPKCRYTLGRGAFSLLLLHGILPSRVWDSVVRKVFSSVHLR